MEKDPEILGVRVDPTSYEMATSQVLFWAQKQESRYVCVANVHMIMEAYDAPDFKDIVNAADLVTPDGMPLVWMLRRMGYPQQERVYGPDLTLEVIAAAALFSFQASLAVGRFDEDFVSYFEDVDLGFRLRYAL